MLKTRQCGVLFGVVGLLGDMFLHMCMLVSCAVPTVTGVINKRQRNSSAAGRLRLLAEKGITTSVTLHFKACGCTCYVGTLASLVHFAKEKI